MESIRDREACTAAAVLLKEGRVIGTYVRGVCGLWADGRSEEALDTIYAIKGEERADRPLSTTLMSPLFVEMVNGARIPAPLKGLFFDADELATHLGSMCFIRAPIRSQTASPLPSRLVSQSGEGTYWLQNWLPEGCEPTRRLMEALHASDLDVPAVTSMNVSGEPEIVDPEEGLAFSRDHDVPLFLADLDSPERVKGSFPIVQVDEEGMRLLRAGHFDPRFFRYLTGDWEIDLSDYRSGNYPLADIPDEVEELAPDGDLFRLRLLEWLDG
jgi:tRNA A37 threonylcarbamoyladenosine synthetase subunit TsaC/SUA5/YrdC